MTTGMVNGLVDGLVVLEIGRKDVAQADGWAERVDNDDNALLSQLASWPARLGRSS